MIYYVTVKRSGEDAAGEPDKKKPRVEVRFIFSSYIDTLKIYLVQTIYNVTLHCV